MWLRNAIWNWWRKRHADAELDEEVRSYVDLLAQEKIRAGMSSAQARREAKMELGGVEQVKEQTREVRAGHFVETLWQDIRYGARMLRKNPGFTIVAVLTLALGIGATTTIFSVINGLILRKPSVRDPSHLVIVSSASLANAFGANHSPVSASDYMDWREQATDFAGMAAGDFDDFTLSGGTTPEFVPGARVSANFFQVLGVQPILGRPILPGEDRAGDDHVVLLSEDLWKGKFGGDPHLLGQTIKINGNAYTVAGVMPDSFLPWDFDAQIWIPLVFSPDETGPGHRNFRFLRVFARLKPGASASQAVAQMKTIAQRIAQAHTDTNRNWGTSVMSLQQYSIADSNTETALVFLMAAVGFVLLIACANLAGLLLARNSRRRREFSIRAVLGAGRIRLARQLLTECLLLSLAGGALGTLFAFWGVRAVVAQLNWNEGVIALAKELSIDAHVLIFTIGISILAALVFGIAPALQISRREPGQNLKEGGRGITGGREGIRLQRVLVIGQLALSLILLMGAGLFVEGFVQEMHASAGFNPSNVLTASVSLRGLQYYRTPQRQAAFFENALRQVTSFPQVESAAVASDLPFSFPSSVHFSIEGQTSLDTAEQRSCGYVVVSPGYFKTLQIPLLEGREFARSDTIDSAPAAIVDQAFARKYFPHREALGQHILIRSDKRTQNQWSEIVGVVRNVNEFLGETQPRAHIFESFLARPVGTMNFAVRTRTEPESFSDPLRHAIWAVDSGQAVSNLKTMNRVIADSGQGDDVMAELMGAFAMIALVMAAIGIYGVLSFLAALRTHEIGIRMALGAEPRQVLMLIMRGGLGLTGAGAAIGFLVSLLLPKIVGSAFNGFYFNGWWVLGIASFMVVAVALAACYIPARRAMRVDPMTALRYE